MLRLHNIVTKKEIACPDGFKEVKPFNEIGILLLKFFKMEFLEKELNKFNKRINNPNTYEDLIGITNEEQQMEIATMFIE